MSAGDDMVEVLIWKDQLKLLKKHAFPCSEAILASAEKVEIDGEGDVLLRGSRSDFEQLAGFVALEANERDRSRRRTRIGELWSELSDRIECAL
jgi:hypothetical protein